MATRSTKTTPKAKTAAKAAPKTTKAKATPAKSTGSKAAPAAPKATIVETVTPVVAGAPIKKPELIDRVVAETGMKKKDVKPVVEAMLAVLGRALAGGEEITAPPMGKLMIKKSKDVANAQILTLKLRHPMGDKGPGKDPLAQAAE